MATYLSYLVPAVPIANTTLFTATLTTGTASGQLVVGFKSIIGISMSSAAGAVTNGMTVRFGNVNRSQAATTTDFFLPPGLIHYFDTGPEFDRVSMFNPAAVSGIYYIHLFEVAR